MANASYVNPCLIFLYILPFVYYKVFYIVLKFVGQDFDDRCGHVFLTQLVVFWETLTMRW
jgi:hypothetical protein